MEKSQSSVCIEYVDTELGEEILQFLESKGWKIKTQYSPLMFDKGIDYDSYTLKLAGDRVEFEWDNWFEWKIIGPSKILTEIAQEYALKLKPVSQ